MSCPSPPIALNLVKVCPITHLTNPIFLANIFFSSKMVSLKVLLTVGFGLQASAATIKIDVGEGGLTFDPESVTAAVNDVLEFHFFGPDTHSVAVSEFDDACQPITNGGFYSGDVSVSSSGESVSPPQTPFLLSGTPGSCKTAQCLQCHHQQHFLHLLLLRGAGTL